MRPQPDFRTLEPDDNAVPVERRVRPLRRLRGATSGDVRRPPPLKRRWFPIAAAFLMLSIGFAAAETSTRLIFRYNTPDTVRANSLQYAPAAYARHLLAPSQNISADAAWGPRAGRERPGRFFRINALGYRGPEVAAAKPPGVCRVVILGGSSVFDTGASEGEDWPRLTEKRLHELGRDHVEVINAGVPGHSTSDSLGRLYTQLWMYRPDFVLLYNAWNDIKQFAALSPEKPLITQVRSSVLGDDPFQSYRNTVDRILSSSQMYVKLRTRYLRAQYDVGPEGVRNPGALAGSFSEWGVEQYRLNLAAFVSVANHVGATPVLLTEATLAVPDAPESDRKRIEYNYVGLDHDALASAFDACSESVRGIAAEKEVPMLDVGARLNGRSELFRDHVHTTKAGSAALADLVASFLDPLTAGCP